MKKLLISLLCFISASVMAAPSVVFETSMGKFTVELDSEKAPITAANFLKYVEDGSYAGAIFHRIIPNFMAQGGGFDTDMKMKPSYAAIKNEAENGLKNKVATIAMARTNNPDSATRQFFINYSDNHFLDYQKDKNAGYAVFGKVTAGFEIIQNMAKQPTKTLGRYHDVPATAIVINKVTVQK